MDKIQTIKAEIYFDGEYYCVRCLNIDVFTQGKTLDEAVKNLREAVSLHLEDEDWKELNRVSERNQISKEDLINMLR